MRRCWKGQGHEAEVGEYKGRQEILDRTSTWAQREEGTFP